MNRNWQAFPLLGNFWGCHPCVMMGENSNYDARDYKGFSVATLHSRTHQAGSRSRMSPHTHMKALFGLATKTMLVRDYSPQSGSKRRSKRDNFKAEGRGMGGRMDITSKGKAGRQEKRRDCKKARRRQANKKECKKPNSGGRKGKGAKLAKEGSYKQLRNQEGFQAFWTATPDDSKTTTLWLRRPSRNSLRMQPVLTREELG